MRVKGWWMAAAAGLVAGAAWAQGGARMSVAGLNDDPKPGPAGTLPYEMAERTEPHKPIFDLQDLSGWRVEGADVDVQLYRTREQRLWLPFAAKVVYRTAPGAASPGFVLRPEQPIPLPEPWDCLEFWGWGNGNVSAIVEGADGVRVEVGMGRTDAQYWFLHHAKVGRPIARPARLVGLRYHDTRADGGATIYVGPGYAFKEELPALTFAAWPRKLPFPTRPETILPLQKAAGFTNTAARKGNVFAFTYRGPDCTLGYEYRPTDGGLGDIVLLHDGQAVRPMAGGGLHLVIPGGEAGPTNAGVRRELVGARLADGVVTARWRLTSGAVTANLTLKLRMRAKSLIIDMEAPEPVVGRVSLGAAEGLTAPRLFPVPYLTYGGNDPRILLAGGLFHFSQFDWYRSDASVLYGAASVEGGRAAFNGGAEYIPKTDGKRNPLRERLFLNVSPDVQEVLPSIPNPPSVMKVKMADRLWRVKHGEDYAVEVAEARRFAAYGMDKVACRYHEEQWRDGDESFTFREHAAPGRGGDAALAAEVAAIKSCGWLVGLYTNFTDFATVNANWSPDRVSRNPDGNYYSSWWRCYAPKPMYAVEAARKYAPIIAKRFGADHSYCDVHTAVSPFSRVDYDARVPGAGMFRRTFECFGRVLYEQKFAYNGPVYSEGNNHWWYAGLVDGNYGQLGSTASWRDPLFVDFDLLHMHPLSMDAGMGEIGMYYRGPLPDLALERFRAVTLAYGHIGYLDYQTFSSTWKELIKTYYLQQPLQRHYVMEPVRSIRYADASGRLMETSEALITDAYRTGRLEVVYQTGFRVVVNGSSTPWEVDGPGGKVTLPEWGYLASSKDGATVSASAMAPGAGRIEYCVSPGSLFLDSRGGGLVTVGPIGVDGAAAVKRVGKEWWIIPALEAREVRLDIRALGIAGDARVQAVDEAGNPAGAADASISGGVLTLRPGARPAFRYIVAAR